MTTRLLSIFIFVPSLILSQPKVTVLSSINREKTLYFGVANHIKLEGVDMRSAIPKLSHGDIYQNKHGTYEIHVNSDRPDTLNIYSGKKLIGREIFEIKRIPTPIARVGGLKDSIAKVNQILASPLLIVYLPDCNYKHEFIINSFQASFITAYADTITTLVSRINYFSEEQKSMIRTLKTGDQIYFFDIRVSCPDCRLFKLPPFRVFIN